jgi:hypothetical protein
MSNPTFTNFTGFTGFNALGNNVASGSGVKSKRKRMSWTTDDFETAAKVSVGCQDQVCPLIKVCKVVRVDYAALPIA